MADKIVANRSYVDNFSVKEFAENDLMGKYFGEEEVSDRTVGMLGYTTELLSHISEDAFNMGSVLFRESFPNRAEIPESIYSHAAIFQINDVFSKASACRFILVMDESAIIENMELAYNVDADGQLAGNNGIYRFYIDKDTLITVEDKDYCIDYDVQLNIIKRVTEGDIEYLFTGRYLMPEYTGGNITTNIYKNSISDLADPYVKIRRSKDGYVAIEISCHQCYREVVEEEIVSNSIVNYSTITVPYQGQLAGFDVLYQTPDSNEWQQLDTKIIYSQATEKPFCYYQMTDDDTFKLSFNSQDQYFTPKFNSKLRIILYMTEGADGDFDVYNGTNIVITPYTENYPYAKAFLTAAKPLGASQGGRDQGTLESLQEITVENYRTATALTTENDLQEFFNNYKNYYGNADILFLKKRNDIFERVYSAFILMRNGTNYIYNTNTLKMHINIDDMVNPEKNVYMLEPGFLFTANENDGYARLLRDEDKSLLYFQDYKEAYEVYQTLSDEEFDEYIKENPGAKHIRYIDNYSDYSLVPDYLKRAASFASFKTRNNLDDKRTVFDMTDDDIKVYDDYTQLKFLLMNPFLIYFRKNPNVVSTYMTYVQNHALLDFTAINDEMFVQFIGYTLHVEREFEKEKRYKIYTDLVPNITLSEENPIITPEYDEYGQMIGYIFNDKFGVENNSLRVIVEIMDGNKSVCFTELYPTMIVDDNSNAFRFENYIYTDDHISSDTKLRILKDEIFRFYEKYTDTDLNKTYNVGDYFKVDEHDNTIYHLYNADDELIASDIDVTLVTKYHHRKVLRIYRNVWNTSSSSDMIVPMSDCTVKVHTLFNKEYSEFDSKLVNVDRTDNKFAEADDDYNSSYDFYVWTNEYTTGTYPIDFLKALNSVRTYLTFDDYTLEYVTELEDEVVENTDRWYVTSRFYDEETEIDFIEEDYFKSLEYGSYNLYDANGAIKETGLPISLVIRLYKEGKIYKLKDENENIYTVTKNVITGEFYRRTATENPNYTHFDFLGNRLDTDITPEQMEIIKENGPYIDTEFVYDINDVNLNTVSFIRANLCKRYDYLTYFMNSFSAQYDFLVDIIKTRLRNETNMDIKFYNTYGRSNRSIIGENGEHLDTVNVCMEFDMWFVTGTDMDSSLPQVKEFIKVNVELLNNLGLNNVYISNLMRKIENTFSFVDHIRFKSINKYDSYYQTIKADFLDLNDLTVIERRDYVPELIVVDVDDITINEYYV